jgi:DNA-binding SARP family transcriptional activator
MARRNLTKALTNLRQLLEPYLLIERHSVAFNHQAAAAVDVVIFLAAVEGSAVLEPDDPGRDLAPLRQAVSLYRADFLEGFYVKNALEFEEWALGQREYLRELMLQALRRLTGQSARLEADPAVALAYCRRWLRLEAWQEEAHRQMMLLLARSGQRDAALAQYETCRRLLAEELGVEPMPETTALYERLKAAGTAPPHNLSAPPNVLVGREAELQQAAGHLANPDCRLLTIVGPGGIGKTRLALEAARGCARPEAALEGVSFADGVYLVNLTPPEVEAQPAALADRLAVAIADALNFSFQGPADLMTQLLNYLRRKQMLLVLDNFDHFVAAVTCLADILRHAPEVKLLVTSRERLNLQEEYVLEVAGLTYPGDEQRSRGAEEQGGRGERQSPGISNQLSVTSVPPSLTDALSGTPQAPMRSPEHPKPQLPMRSLERPNYHSYSAIALFTQRAQQTLAGFTLL